MPEIAPRPEDTLIPKKHPSAFFGTPLVSYLVDKGIDSIIVTGCTTSGCVRGSVVDAFAYNFRVAVCSDAVYDRSHVSHCVNLFDMSEKYADVMTTDQCVQALDRVALGRLIRIELAPAFTTPAPIVSVQGGPAPDCSVFHSQEFNPP